MIKMSSLYKKWKQFQENTERLGQNIAQHPQKLANKIKIAVDNNLKKLSDWINNVVEELNALANRVMELENIITEMIEPPE